MDVEVPLAVQRRTERAGLPRVVHPGPEHLADPRVLLPAPAGVVAVAGLPGPGGERRCHQRAADRYHRSWDVRVEVGQDSGSPLPRYTATLPRSGAAGTAVSAAASDSMSP